MGELSITRGARSVAIEGGTEVNMTTSTSAAAQMRRTVEVTFLYLDLNTCSRCRGRPWSVASR
jgi:hypothetical protein